MDTQEIVRVEGLKKQYGLPPRRSLRRVVADLLRGRSIRGRGPAINPNAPWALNNVSFSLRHGESLGILGRNGAGKSTLLKILAGVTPPTDGTIEVEGRIFPMIELSAGVHAELTGRENARLLGVIMGLTRRESEARLPRIETFAELDEWFDRPVRTYSSGMRARLSFAVAVHMRADILLIDEILGVGDLAFFNKSMRAMEEMRAAGRGMILVSHSLGQVRRICDRVLVLERGRVVFDGMTEEGIGVYEEIIEKTKKAAAPVSSQEFDFIGASIAAIGLRGEDGAPVQTIRVGENVDLTFTLVLTQLLDNPSIHVVVTNVEGLIILWHEKFVDRLEAGQHRFVVEWRDLRLRGGDYFVRIDVGVGQFSQRGFRSARALEFRVAGDMLNRGIYVPDAEFRMVD